MTERIVDLEDCEAGEPILGQKSSIDDIPLKNGVPSEQAEDKQGSSPAMKMEIYSFIGIPEEAINMLFSGKECTFKSELLRNGLPTDGLGKPLKTTLGTFEIITNNEDGTFLFRGLPNPKPLAILTQ